jgi:hypothetical protein
MLYHLNDVFQRHGGSLGGLFILGPEPGGLGELWAGRGAVHQDGGSWGRFLLRWTRHLIGSWNQKDPEGGSVVNANKHANAMTLELSGHGKLIDGWGRRMGARVAMARRAAAMPVFG